jgi:serine/threonine-protein kinase HipA
MTVMVPEELRAVEQADVYKGDRFTGTLRRDGSDVVFTYDQDYADDPESPNVAWSLPKSVLSVRAGGGNVPSFFAGLLPEGARLGAIVTVTRTSIDDHLTLLLAVGSDTIGDVRVLPDGAKMPEHQPALNVDEAESLDFDSVFESITGADTLDLDTSAVPGVQPKVSTAMVSAPVGTSIGPAILKLNPQREFPKLVENEAYFLSLARSCGIEVPDHRILTDKNGRTGLLIRRFDRHRDPAGKMIMLAQEDACQVLNVYPASKYRLRMQDVVIALADTCEQGRGSRTIAALRLLELIAFSYLIGNGDLHGKNFSIGQNASGSWAVTPAYDLICTQPYASWRDPMALNLYGRANRLNRQHLVEAGDRLQLRERAVTSMLDRICDRAAPRLSGLGEIGFSDAATQRLADLIKNRMAQLRGVSG